MYHFPEQDQLPHQAQSQPQDDGVQCDVWDLSGVPVMAHVSDLRHQHPLRLLLHLPAPDQGPPGEPPGLPQPADDQLRHREA